MQKEKTKKSIFVYALTEFQNWCSKTAALACVSGITGFLAYFSEEFSLPVDPKTPIGLVSLVALIVIGVVVINKAINALILFLESKQIDREISVVDIFLPEREPSAQGKKIAVLIPRLSGDVDDTTREHIISFILNDIGHENVEILRSKRLLAWDENASTENQSKRAIIEGRAMMISRSADIIIWGRCYKSNNMEMVDLHFTTREQTGETSQRFEVKNMSLDYAFTKALIKHFPQHRLIELTKKYHYDGDVKVLGEQRMRDLYDAALKSTKDNDFGKTEITEALFSLDEPALIEKTNTLDDLYNDGERAFSEHRFKESHDIFSSILNHPDFDLVNENMFKLSFYNQRIWNYSDCMVYWHMAQLYLDGLGVDKNEKTAFYYTCRHAEASKTARAFWQVVEMCEKGIGIEKDEATIKRWKDKAIKAEQNAIDQKLMQAEYIADPRYKGDQLAYAKKFCFESLANPHVSETQNQRIENIMKKIDALKEQFQISDDAMMTSTKPHNKEAA